MAERFCEYRGFITAIPEYGRFEIRQCLIQVENKSGPISYFAGGQEITVKVVNVQCLSLNGILNSDLHILTAFYFCKYKEFLKKEGLSDKIKVDIKNDFQKIYKSILDLNKEGDISFDEATCLKSYMLSKIEQITKDSTFIEEVIFMADELFKIDPKYMTEQELEHHKTCQALQEKTQALQEKTQALQEKTQALEEQIKVNEDQAAEIAQLKAQLAAAGIKSK